MNRWGRVLGWTLFGAGVLAGMVAARGATEPPVRQHYREYTIVAGDFHVHSFPGDGALAPWDIAVEANRRGLDVVALTNHNHLLSWRLMEMLGLHPAGAMLIRGEELTAAGYHMAAIGIRETVSWRQSPADAARAIHAQGGVAIAAHPAGPDSTRFDAAALDAIDGFEAAHPLMEESAKNSRSLAEFRSRAAAYRPSLAAIGSTDFHAEAPIGLCRTFLFVTTVSPAAVLEAIRAGRTVACDATGHVYGPAELTSVVTHACADAAGSPPRDRTALSNVGSVLLWLGLAVLVASGAREGDLE